MIVNDLDRTRTPPTAFVTGATGLLGNNLVRELLGAGYRVKALARSKAKAASQLDGLDIEIVEGDILEMDRLAPALKSVDVLFHTAAYFRDSYKGGTHWPQLHAVNVIGTRNLLAAAYSAGVRRFVYASSIAVLRGERGQLIDETMLRDEKDADEYYRSKILAEREVSTFLDQHPDMWGAMVLPGWMHGPGDAGPTSAGQMVMDFVNGKLAGTPPGTVSLVDARDVAIAMLRTHERGSRGERYLAAGRHMTTAELIGTLATVTGRTPPRRTLPLWLLYAIAGVSEASARITGKPALLSLAMVRAIVSEQDRSHFSHVKSKRDLGLTFRPVSDTLRDVVDWYRGHGYFAAAKAQMRN